MAKEDKEDCEIIHIPRERDYIARYDDAVQFVSVNTFKGEIVRNAKTVIRDNFKITKKYNIDGNTMYEFSIEKKGLIMGIDEILTQLKADGKISKGALVRDTLQIMAGNIKDVEIGHSAIGIYEDSEKLVLCLEPIPLTDEQRTLLKILKTTGVFNYKAKRGDIEKYVQLLSYYHPYEIYPIMGMAMMAPYNLILKDYRILIPFVYLYGKETSIGKSLILQVFTSKLFGVPIKSANSLESKFRLNIVMDSACLPRGFDEGESINFDKKEEIRESCENKYTSSRGRADLTMANYMARLSLFFTGNDIHAKKRETLKRFFIIHYDETRKKGEHYKKKSSEVEALYIDLKPIGFEITKYGLHYFKTKEKLYNTVMKYKEILQSKVNFSDATKPWSWSVCYVGLLIWDKFCKEYDVDWHAPTIDEFAKIINKVEISTWEGVEETVMAFRDWFDGWLSDRTYKGEEGIESIKGDGKTWKYDNIEGDDGPIFGYWITNTILQDYNKNALHSGTLQISNLKKLAETISQVFNIEVKLIADLNSGKLVKFGMVRKRATFIPLSEEGE